MHFTRNGSRCHDAVFECVPLRMDRFFRRLGIIAALALGVLGITATALGLAFPSMDHAWWQIILWGCGISFAGLVLWLLWELNILSRNWRRNWEFRWPITKKQNISSDNNLTRRSPISPDGVLEPQDACYLDDKDAKGYPHKLKIVLTNESAGNIIVTPAEWRNIWNFTSPPLNEHPWQREGPHGWQNKDWGEETPEPLLVRSGRAIQTWVGLPGPVDTIELRRRIMTKRLGILIVPFTIDGRATSETIRL
jgi:hypothetical protein